MKTVTFYASFFVWLSIAQASIFSPVINRIAPNNINALMHDAFFMHYTTTTIYLVTKIGEYLLAQKILPKEISSHEDFPMTQITLDAVDAKKLALIYAQTLDRLNPRQRGFVENFLNNPETAGDVRNSGKAAKYAQGGINQLYSFVPSENDMPDVIDTESMHPLTMAILIGMRLKAETLRQIEHRKGEQRVRLGITSDWVLKNLKEIAVRTMGYEFDPETLDRKAGSEFQKSSFQPAAAQRSLEALGREMGMFYDRGPGEKPKSYDEMEVEELDAEIAKLDQRIAQIQREREELGIGDDDDEGGG